MVEVVIQGILLGLSTGLFCLGYCAPVFVPLMMSEKRVMAHDALVVGELALGRLLAYLIFGAAAGYLGMRLDGPSFQRAVGWAMVVLSALLLLYVATRRWPHFTLCRWVNGRYFRFPIVFGFITGINVCPPFVLAISYTFGLGSITKGGTPFRWLLLGDINLPPCAAPAGVFGTVGEFASSRFDNSATFGSVLLTDGSRPTHGAVRTWGIIHTLLRGDLQNSR